VEDLVTGTVNPDPGFWHNRRVFLTGHTGFKGAWAALSLNALGAQVYGYALPPEGDPNLWRGIDTGLLAGETLADLADQRALSAAVASAGPQVVIHMAAQALVRRSFEDPVGTIATNAMGTVHLLEALRGSDGLEAVLVVTTDKVYANDDAGRDFIESDPLGGHDPYSASKAAAEIMARSYAESFFEPRGIPVATARAGNVIGGGDWSADRLVPDVWRAMRAGEPIRLRAPESTRPWQHVLEPVGGYLIFAEALVRKADTPRALNFGPLPGSPITVAEVASAMGAALGFDRPWIHDQGEHPPEMKMLSLNPELARASLGWRPRLDHRTAIEWTAQWYGDFLAGGDAAALCLDQLRRYEALQ
jgi:CDP-glucose 4,6-dehydratase